MNDLILQQFKDVWEQVNPNLSFGEIIDDFSRWVYRNNDVEDISQVEDENIINLFNDYIDYCKSNNAPNYTPKI